MIEKVINAGKQKNLVGILTEAASTDARGNYPSVLILNSGLVHRPGPFRVNAELAREIAKLGFNVLRMDISGIGDSEIVPNDNRAYEQRNVDDIGEFINYLSSSFNEGVIIIGLCTGADLGHRAAVENEEVVASILFDGYGYPTFKFYLKKFMSKFRRKKIINSLKRMFKRLTGKKNKVDHSESGVDAYFWKLPPKSTYKNDLKILKERNVKQFYIYTGGVADYYNYKNQLLDGFKSTGLVDGISLEYYPKADHTYPLMHDRARMFKDVKRWLSMFVNDHQVGANNP